MRLLVLIGVSGCLSFAQSLSIGAIGGIRITDDIRSSGQTKGADPGRPVVSGGTTSESRRYVVGPAIEVGLPFRLALEFDALYRPEGYRSDVYVSSTARILPGGGPIAGNTRSRERADSWEFPILLKYKIPLPVIAPYVEAGYAHRIIRGSIDANEFVHLVQTFQPLDVQIDFPTQQSSTNWRDSQGVVSGLGVQFTFGHWLVSPEVRYTRWNNAAIQGAPAFARPGLAGIGPGFESARNQVDVQLGLRWKTH